MTMVADGGVAGAAPAGRSCLAAHAAVLGWLPEAPLENTHFPVKVEIKILEPFSSLSN